MNRDLAYILDKVVWLGIFLLPFLPLIITTGLFFPYITGKAFFFRFLVQIVFVCWALLAIYDQKYRPDVRWFLFAVFGWLGVTVLSGLLGVDPFRSFYSNFERMEGVVTYIHLTAYFVVLISMLKTEKAWKYFFQTSVFVSILVALYGLLQLAGRIDIMQGGVRLDSTLGNAAYLAFYASLHVFLIAWLWLKEESSKIRWFYGALVLLQLFIVYKTATRGAVIGLLAASLLMTLLSALFYRENKKIRLWSGVALMMVVLFVGGFWFVRDVPAIRDHQVLGRFASISVEEQTTRSRFMIWQMAWDGFLARPVLGHGPDNFRYVFNSNYNPRMYDQEQWFDRSHNLIFDWLTTTGILGLNFYLLMLFSALFLIWRKAVFSFWERNILTGFLVAYLVQVMFVFDNIVTYWLLFSLLAFVYVNSSGGVFGVRVFAWLSGFGESVIGRQVLASLLVILFLPFFYLSVFKPLMASAYLVSGMKAVVVNPASALDSFQKAIAYNTTGRVEAKEQMTMASMRVLGNESLPESLRQSFGEAIYQNWQQEILLTPLDTRVYVFFGSFLNAVGRFDEAIGVFEKALELSPDKQTILFELISVYLNSGNLDKALEIAEYTFNLTPENPEGRRFYAIVLYNAGEIQKADELLLEGFGTLAVNDDRLLNIFVTQERYEVVADIWRQRAERNPSDLETWFSYAGSFIGLGQAERAIEVLEEAKEYLPERVEEIDSAIIEVRAGRVQIR